MEISRRDAASVGLIGLGFACALLYQGAGINFAVLIYSTGFLLAAVAMSFLTRAQHVHWCLISSLLVGYVVYLLVALYWSSLPENSVIESWLLASVALVFLAVSQQGKASWSVLCVLITAVGLVSAVWGLAEFIATRHRANGPIIDPSAWGISMNMLFFFVLASYLRLDHPPGQRFLHEAALAVFSAASFAAYSRVGTVIWFVAMFCMTLISLLWVSGSKQLKRKILTGAVIGLVCFSLVHGYAGQTEASHSEGYTVNLEEKGWSQRFAIWEAAWRLYLDNPWLGTGVGTFKVNYPQYRTPGDLHTIGNYAHNDYLQLLVEGGPLLLFFTCLVGAVVAWSWFRNIAFIFDKQHRDNAIESIGLSIAVATAYAHALMSFSLLQLPVQILIGMMLARLVLANQLTKSYDVPLRRSSRIMLLAVLILPFSVLYLDGMSYSIVYKQSGLPLVKSIQSDEASTFNAVSYLARIRPGNSVNHLALATLYRKSMDSKHDVAAKKTLGIAAALEYEAALEHNPWRYMTRIYFAELLRENPHIYEELPHLPAPDVLLKRAIERAPVYLEPYLAMAEHMRRGGRHREAYVMLKERALPWINLPIGNPATSRQRLLVQLKDLATNFGDAEMLELVYQEAQNSS